MFHVLYIICWCKKQTIFGTALSIKAQNVCFSPLPQLFNFLKPTGEILKIYSSLWIIQMRFLMGKQQCPPAFLSPCRLSHWLLFFHLSGFFFSSFSCIPSLSPSFQNDSLSLPSPSQFFFHPCFCVFLFSISFLSPRGRHAFTRCV